MRCVVITGVSRGLGAAMFAELAGRGDAMFAIGRHFTDEQRRLAAAEPDRVVLYVADLRDPGALPDAGTLHDFLSQGNESVLVHNAATIEPLGPVDTLDADRVSAAVATNLTTPIVLTGAFLAARPAG